MRRLGITQRVEVIPAYGERRDCLDQRWDQLAATLGFQAVPLPNTDPGRAGELIDLLSLDALVLSGGNSLADYAGPEDTAAPERDAFEAALLDAAAERDKPVLGVCRGMQVINVHFGGRLSPVSDHVASRHVITSESAESPMPETRLVNSFHDWGISAADLAPDLVALARHDDGTIEALRHPTRPVTGIMWHPEREKKFDDDDLHLLRLVLQ